jgi:hypothetical protein
LHQLQHLVAQMKDISVQVHEELHTSREWQATYNGYILEVRRSPCALRRLCVSSVLHCCRGAWVVLPAATSP